MFQELLGICRLREGTPPALQDQCWALLSAQHKYIYNTHKQTSERLHLFLSLNVENFPSHRLFPILRIRAGRLCEECQKNRGSRAEDQNSSKASNSHPRILIHGKHRIAKQQIKPPPHPSETRAMPFPCS